MTEPDVGRLLQTLDTLSVELRSHKEELRVADARSKTARTAALVGIVVGVLGSAVGAGGLVFSSHALRTADDIATSRTVGRFAGCIQSNQTTERTRGALVAGVSVLATPIPERSEESQRRLEEFVAQYTERVEAALPYRDCSPAGIGAYYADPPVDPATKQGTG